MEPMDPGTLAAFEKLLGAVRFDTADPEDFWVVADGTEYTGAEGLRAFLEKYGLEESE